MLPRGGARGEVWPISHLPHHCRPVTWSLIPVEALVQGIHEHMQGFLYLQLFGSSGLVKDGSLTPLDDTMGVLGILCTTADAFVSAFPFILLQSGLQPPSGLFNLVRPFHNHRRPCRQPWSISPWEVCS